MTGDTKSTKVPLASARRLCLYKRFLERLGLIGKERTSSAEIGAHSGVPGYQVRKDINWLGEVGIVGAGYSIGQLVERIVTRLGLERKRRCVVVGVGSLGMAVMRHLSGTVMQYEIVAGFDVDKRKIGTSVDGVRVLPISDLANIVKKQHVELGIITVPAAAAQGTVDLMVSAGVRGLLNFTPVVLNVPDDVVRRDIDLVFEIETLSYLLGE